MGNKDEDECPQLLHLESVTMTVANGFKTAVTNTPVLVSPEGAYVMEIFKIFLSVQFASDITATRVDVSISKGPRTAVSDWSDPDTVLHWNSGSRLLVGAAGSSEPTEGTFRFDYGNGGGKGYLFARKQIHLSIDTVNASAALASAQAAILYRLKKVSASEYVGIVSE
jgi:hypothetical protein